MLTRVTEALPYIQELPEYKAIEDDEGRQAAFAKFIKRQKAGLISIFFCEFIRLPCNRSVCANENVRLLRMVALPLAVAGRSLPEIVSLSVNVNVIESENVTGTTESATANRIEIATMIGTARATVTGSRTTTTVTRAMTKTMLESAPTPRTGLTTRIENANATRRGTATETATTTAGPRGIATTKGTTGVAITERVVIGTMLTVGTIVCLRTGNGSGVVPSTESRIRATNATEALTRSGRSRSGIKRYVPLVCPRAGRCSSHTSQRARYSIPPEVPPVEKPAPVEPPPRAETPEEGEI